MIKSQSLRIKIIGKVESNFIEWSYIVFIECIYIKCYNKYKQGHLNNEEDAS